MLQNVIKLAMSKLRFDSNISALPGDADGNWIGKR